MHKHWILALIAGLFLVGCTQGDYPEAYEQETQQTESEESEGVIIKDIAVDDFEAETVVLRKLNETCGADTGPCGPGLLCAGTTDNPEQTVCKLADLRPELKCRVDKVAEVCGEREGVRRTYQNDCFAAKAGAEVVSEGYCPPEA